MTRLALIALAALVATPALAGKGKQETIAAPETASAQASPDAKAEQKTCRYFANTASRLKSERLCLTKDQWRKFDEQQY
jgi:hypothetical protein